ncbi:uroporphyrinogen-III synthase [Mongoliimonas terrestris]|uniref:uroporphyrinogen-III synthase n=1 Tax=Mongoliimonas terrestris TaxID=1709001 RepID=UPI0009497821|nr:uroporphyrinogen-III synthase [Mongoliimonas terrestris]
MRVLVLRPEPQASRTVRALQDLGIAAEAAPLLTIVPEPGALAAIGPAPIQALLMSSPAAADVVAGADAGMLARATPVVAVGSRTAEAARAAGFASVTDADGDADALVAAVRQRCRPEAGRLVLLAGRDRAGGIDDRLAADGFVVDVVEVYRAEQADRFDPETARSLAAGTVDGAIVASARTAEALLRCWTSAKFQVPAARPAIIALSAAVAAPIRDVFAHLVVAERPDGESLIKAAVALRDRVENNGAGSGPQDQAFNATPNGPSRDQTEERTAMASETDDKKSGPGGPGTFDPKDRRKGKPTTLDLKATEVATPPGASDAPGAPAGPSPSPATGAGPSSGTSPAAGSAPAGSGTTVGTASTGATATGPAPIGPASTGPASAGSTSAGSTSTGSTAAGGPAAGSTAGASGAKAATATAGKDDAVKSPSTPTSPTSSPSPAASPTGGSTTSASAAGTKTGTAAAGSSGPSGLGSTTGPSRGTDAPVAAAMPPRTPERRSGGLGAFAAALLGGVVTLAGGAGLLASGVLDPYLGRGTDPAALSSLQTRIAELDSQLAAARSAPATDPAVAERLAALETSVGGLPSGSDPAIATLQGEVAALREAIDGLAPVRDDVARLGEQLSAVDARAIPADPTARLDELAAAVEALRSGAEGQRDTLQRLNAAAARPVVDPARVDALQTELDGLGQRLAALDTTLGQRLGSLEGTVTQRLGTLNSSVGELKGQLDGAVRDLTGRVDTAAADLRGEVESSVSGLRETVDPLTGRIESLETTLANQPDAASVAALSLAVTTLASKVTSGEPFATDLAVIRQTGTELPDLGPLEAHAETGVATTSELVNGFPVDRILDARPMDPNVGVWDRVVDGAKSLVNYREAGETATDPLSAPLDATQAALNGGDLAGAAAAYEGLPDWAKTASADWKSRLDARVAVDSAVAALADQTMSRLQPQATQTAD